MSDVLRYSDGFIRRPLTKIDKYICWFQPEKSPQEIYLESSEVFWHLSGIKYTKLGTILWFLPGPRILAEVLPHYTQCILMLLMAIERYVIVCHPTRADSILSRKRRIAMYVFATISLTAVCTLLSSHYFNTAIDWRGSGVTDGFENVGNFQKNPLASLWNLQVEL